MIAAPAPDDLMRSAVAVTHALRIVGGRHDARERLIDFAQRMYPAYQAAPHHVAIADHLEAVERGDIDRLVIMMPPRHGKSLIASELFPAWFLGRNPDKRMISCSYAADLAYRFSRRARNALRSPMWPFPDVRTAEDSAAVNAWDIAGRRGGLVAAGVGGPITGLGADILTIDDPVKNVEEAESATYREHAWDWYTSVAYTRLEKGGAIVLIGTRWHADDLIGRALDGGDDWMILNLPAIAEDDDQIGRLPGEALWSDKYPVAALQRIQRVSGSRVWSSLYQQRPSPAEGGLLKRHWWRFWHYPGQPLPPVDVKRPDGSFVQAPCLPLPPFWDEQAQSWDMAFAGKETSDYVCGQVWGAWRADRYLLDQILAHLDFPATIGAVRDLSGRWPRAVRKLVEAKANGQAVVDTLHQEIGGLVLVEPVGGKVVRVHAAAPQIESGNVYLPHPRIAPWVDAFIDECASFPNGRHDDQVDGMTQALIRFGAGSHSETVVSSYLAGDDEDEAEGQRWP